ncbi:MAG: tRNA (adenosine(37)-N6)-threonylcarbamoyltransferase complex transferase subunit TsaD [Calditrichota bacterium]
MRILGIETSCDETSAAVINNDAVLSNIISSQQVHMQFGGVVPELASRAHLRKILPIVAEALDKAKTSMEELDGIAVTHGPGLIGALMVGVNYAKAMSAVLKKPLVGVNHIEGHVYSNFLDEAPVELPMICLIVSGGHTQIVRMDGPLKYEILGKTRDDAVGEAYDKVAKLLGLPYPGGPQVDKLAKEGDDSFCDFPIGLYKEKTFDFSYSGLKTAVLTKVRELGEETVKEHLADICASFQRAAVAVLVKRTIRAARENDIKQITVAGGVAANSLLRSEMKHQAEKHHINVYCPPMKYCTDNAAMIARAGLERLRHGQQSTNRMNAYPALRLGDEKSYL